MGNQSGVPSGARLGVCDLLTETEREQSRKRRRSMCACEEADECCGGADPLSTSGGVSSSSAEVQVKQVPPVSLQPPVDQISDGSQTGFAEELDQRLRLLQEGAAVRPPSFVEEGTTRSLAAEAAEAPPLFPHVDQLLKPNEAKTRLEEIVTDWRRRLQAGLVVSLDREPVTICYDQDLQCLDIREHGSLHPLGVLSECKFPAGGDNDGFSVAVAFEGLDELIFQFDEEADRVAFALTLQVLANEAREDKWHEAGVEDEEEEEEVEEEDSEGEEDECSPSYSGKST